MTNIDISPEAVERLKNRLAEFWAYDTGHLFGAADDIIDALSAALTQSRAETAAAYERAVEVLDMEAEDLKSDASRFRSGTDPHHYRMNFASAAIRQAKAIRALAKPDQTAALDEVKAAAREQGMREAAAIAEKQKEVFLSPEYAGRFPTNSFAERFACTEVSNAILAAIPKGGDA